MEYTYRRTLVKKSAAATYDDLDDEKVNNGNRLEINHISVENRTTAYTRLVIGMSDGLEFHKLVEEDAPAADDIYWHDRPFFVPEGWFIRCRLTGCTNGDDLRVFINGLMVKVR